VAPSAACRLLWACLKRIFRRDNETGRSGTEANEGNEVGWSKTKLVSGKFFQTQNHLRFLCLLLFQFRMAELPDGGEFPNGEGDAADWLKSWVSRNWSWQLVLGGRKISRPCCFATELPVIFGP